MVVSLPAPQAAELLTPHLFATEAAAIPMTPCWAVLAAFKERFDVPWDGAFIHDSPLAWVARNSSKTGRPSSYDCWVRHADSDWSAAHLEAFPGAISPLLLEALATAAGVPTPATINLAAHRWRYSLGSDPAERKTLFDPETGLIVCGDWLVGGRVEGAFLSGVSAAGCILRQIGIPPCIAV